MEDESRCESAAGKKPREKPKLSSHDEPAGKKPKLSDLSPRSIELDLQKYPQWVKEASDEKLIEIFEIGVMVYNSVALNVSFKQEFIENLLIKKLEPMSETIKSLAKETEDIQKKTSESFQKDVSMGIKEIRQQVEVLKQDVKNDIKGMRHSLVEKVQDVAAKVPSLKDLGDRINNVQTNVSLQVKSVSETLNSSVLPGLNNCETKLDGIKEMKSKPATVGATGEIQILSILKELKSYTITDVSRKGGMGDILVTSPKGDKYIIEVKNCQNAVSAAQIEKFEGDVQNSPEFKAGIMLSLKSGIARRAVVRRFHIEYKNGKYLIYVPNVSSDTGLVIWSVVLADELVALNQENLDDSKLDAVKALYEEFKDNIAISNKCEDDLKLLEKTVESLKGNLRPLLKIVKDAKTKLNGVLHSGKKV